MKRFRRHPLLVLALCPLFMGAMPSIIPEKYKQKLVEQAPWEWGEPVHKHPSRAEARARAVYSPVYVTQLTDATANVQSVLDAVTQGGGWNKRELAAPVYDPATQLVLVGTSDRVFRAVHAPTGKTVWKAQLQGRVSSQPVVDGELVYFGADDGGIYGFRKGTGVQVFRYQADSEVTAPVRLFGDVLVAHTALDTTVALKRESGAWLWQTRHPLPVGISLLGESAPAVGTVLYKDDPPATVVFVGHADGQVSAMDAKDGHTLWSTAIAQGEDFLDVDADLQYDSGILYAAGYHGGVHAMDPVSGAILWTTPIESVNRMTLTASTLVVAGPRQVICLERAGGRIRWRYAFPTGGASTPVVHRGRVLVNTDRGALYVLNFTDGRPLQYYGGKPGFTAAPAVGGDALFLLSNGGWLHALSDRFSGVMAGQRQSW